MISKLAQPTDFLIAAFWRTVRTTRRMGDMCILASGS